MAELAGVSTATVSNFLNGRISAMRGETLARIRTAVEELGYVSSSAAKALRTNRSHVLGVVIPSISGPFFAQFARGAEDEALEHGYMLFVCSSDHIAERERAYAEAMFEKQVDGAIFASSAFGADHVADLYRRGTRIVLFETEGETLDVGTVVFDNVQAASMAVEYLASLGHRRIAHVTGPLTWRTRLARAEGYRAGLEACDLPFEPELILEAPLERKARTGTYELATGEELTRRLVELPDMPTAVFAVNDMAALGVMRGLFNIGMRVPEDVSVMGIDDDRPPGLRDGCRGRPAAAGAARNECASRNECAARGRGRRARAFDSRRPLRAAPGGAGVDRAARWWSHTGRGVGEPRVLLAPRSLYERGRNSDA